MSARTTETQANAARTIDYKLNRHIKLTLEDSMFRYHFTDSIMEPAIKKKDSLLKYKASHIESLLKKCIRYRSMQKSRIEKASGITKAQAGKRPQKDFFIKKSASRFSGRYIIKEAKIRLIDPFEKNQKPIPPIPDVPLDQQAWIGIELCDEQGYVVKNERFELYKGDKRILNGSTDRYGSARIGHLSSGQYNLCFPNIDKNMWHKKGEVAQLSDPDRSGRRQNIKKGESLSLIAAKNNMHWKTIWDHPENQKFKEQNPNPNILNTGDSIFIPSNEAKKYKCSTYNNYRFVKMGETIQVKFKLMNNFKERPNINYTAMPDMGRTIESTTDENGFVDIHVNARCRKVKLSVKDHLGTENYTINLSSLMPKEQEKGRKQRLGNLLNNPEVDYMKKDYSESAIGVFQMMNEIKVTGELDKTTENKLMENHTA